MPSIDPRDVLPQSNLPVPSVPWGRAMQARLQDVEERVLIDKQDIDGQNRTTAAQLAAISEQLNRLVESSTVYVWEESDPTDVPVITDTAPEWASWALVSGGMSVISGGSSSPDPWSRSVDMFTRAVGDDNATQIMEWFASDSILDQMALTATATIDVRNGGGVQTSVAWGAVGTPPSDIRFRLSYFIQWVPDPSPSPTYLEI